MYCDSCAKLIEENGRLRAALLQYADEANWMLDCETRLRDVWLGGDGTEPAQEALRPNAEQPAESEEANVL